MNHDEWLESVADSEGHAEGRERRAQARERKAQVEFDRWHDEEFDGDYSHYDGTIPRKEARQ